MATPNTNLIALALLHSCADDVAERELLKRLNATLFEPLGLSFADMSFPAALSSEAQVQEPPGHAGWIGRFTSQPSALPLPRPTCELPTL